MMNAANSTAAMTNARIASTSSIVFRVPSEDQAHQLDGSPRYAEDSHSLCQSSRSSIPCTPTTIAQMKPIKDVVKKTGLSSEAATSQRKGSDTCSSVPFGTILQDEGLPEDYTGTLS